MNQSMRQIPIDEIMANTMDDSQPEVVAGRIDSSSIGDNLDAAECCISKNRKTENATESEIDLAQEPTTSSNGADELLQEKKAKNRVSAKRFRLRKRQQLQHLRAELETLHQDNTALQATNQELSNQISTLRAENAILQTRYQNAVRAATSLRMEVLLRGSASAFNDRNPFNPPF